MGKIILKINLGVSVKVRIVIGILLERTALTVILDSRGSKLVPKYQVTCSQSQNLAEAYWDGLPVM